MATTVHIVTDTLMNTSIENSQDVDYSYEFDMTTFIIMSSFIFLISAVGTGGNAFVIFVYLRSLRLHDATTKFILNIAVTDLFTAIYIAVYEITIYIDFYGESLFTCLISEQILTYMMFVSQAVIAVATFDRYVAICHHVTYTKIMRKNVVLLLLVAAWTGPLCLATLPLFGFNNFETIPVCIYHLLLPDWLYITFSTFMITMMGIPFFLYIQILRKAIEFYRRFDRKADHTPDGEADEGRKGRIQDRRKAIKNGKVMGMVTLVFIICWLPFQITQFFFGSHYDDNDQIVAVVAYYIGILNCTMNPFIYAWQKKQFRDEARKFLNCIRRRQDESVHPHQKNFRLSPTIKRKGNSQSDNPSSKIKESTESGTEKSTPDGMSSPDHSSHVPERF